MVLRRRRRDRFWQTDIALVGYITCVFFEFAPRLFCVI